MKKSILVFISMILGGMQIGLSQTQPAAPTEVGANKANVAAGEICPKDTGDNTHRSTSKVAGKGAADGKDTKGENTGDLKTSTPNP